MARDRPTRTERLLALLLSRKGRRLSLPEVSRAAGAQHGARLAEIRDLGYTVDNLMQHDANGETHSWYVLRAEPGETPPMFPITASPPRLEDMSRWERDRMRRRG